MGPGPSPWGQPRHWGGGCYLFAVEPSEGAWLGNHQVVHSQQNPDGVLMGKLGAIGRTHLQLGNPSFQTLAVTFFI